MKRILLQVLLVLLLLPAVTTTAHAYIDPGTGSIMLQLILGTIAGAGVVLKLYWHKIRTLSWVARRKNRLDEE